MHVNVGRPVSLLQRCLDHVVLAADHHHLIDWYSIHGGSESLTVKAVSYGVIFLTSSVGGGSKNYISQQNIFGLLRCRNSYSPNILPRIPAAERENVPIIARPDIFFFV